MDQHQINSLLARHGEWVKTLSPQELREYRNRLACGLFLRGITAHQSATGWVITHHVEGWSVEVPTRDLVLAELVAWELILL